MWVGDDLELADREFKSKSEGSAPCVSQSFEK